MVRQRWGRIICVSSVAGIRRQRRAVELRRREGRHHRLHEAIAKEVASRNITANVIAPGSSIRR